MLHCVLTAARPRGMLFYHCPSNVRRSVRGMGKGGGGTAAMPPLEVQKFFLFRKCYHVLLKWAPCEKKLWAKSGEFSGFEGV